MPTTATTTSTHDRRWDALLVCLSLYVLTAVGRIHQLFPLIDVLHPAIVGGGLAIVFYLTSGREERRLAHVMSPPIVWLLVLFVWMTLSMTVSLVMGNSAELVLNNILKTVIMVLVIAGAVRGPRDVRRLAAGYLCAATAYAFVVLLRFQVSAGDITGWRLGRLYYYDANDFAVLVVTALPLGVYFLNTARRLSMRLLALTSLAILMLAFVRSGSRGGFLALIAVVVYMVTRYSAIALRRRVTAAVLMAAIAVGAASATYWHQMSTIWSDTDYNRSDESGRMEIWRRGIGYMMMFPVFGVGPANFSTAEGTLSPMAERQRYGLGVRWNAAHNSYVQIGAETGLPGLVLFVGLLASTFRLLGRARRTAPAATNRAVPELAQTLTASLLGFVVGAFFLSLAYTEMLYALVAFSAGLYKVAAWRPAPVRVRAPQAPDAAPAWAPLEPQAGRSL